MESHAVDLSIDGYDQCVNVNQAWNEIFTFFLPDSRYFSAVTYMKADKNVTFIENISVFSHYKFNCSYYFFGLLMAGDINLYYDNSW